MIETNLEAPKHNIQEKKQFQLTNVMNCAGITPFNKSVELKLNVIANVFLTHFDLEILVES